ncbi:MAG: hypothetical protein OXH70_19220 [Acidobacteria bacterium]|nr:hypothetical protein [Acidobacteriota bacterium]MCY3968373.1 hypothetical protein [Acidobacteriota bacterium]
MTGRTIVAPSPETELMFSDGTTLRSSMSRFVSPGCATSPAEITSTGTIDSTSERCRVWFPVTMISSWT